MVFDDSGKILVTGAAGFIGSKVVEVLLMNGRQVIGIDNLNDYYSPELKNYRLNRVLKEKGFEYYNIDIERYSDLQELFNQNKISAVINLAARAGVRYSQVCPEKYISTNIMGTLNLLELCKATGVTNFILASTSSLYAGSLPPFSETHPVNKPLSPYAASKLGAEGLCHSYSHLYGIQIKILRYFTVYGPAGRPDMSPYLFIKWIAEGKPLRIFGDGEQTRDFTFVDDIANGTIAAMSHKQGFEVINLGGGKKPISVLYMVSLIEKLLKTKANIVFMPKVASDMDSTGADITKAKMLLNWEPQIWFEEGIQKTVDWYLENKDLVSRVTCLEGQ